MKAIRYRITLLEPTLVASPGGAPDSVEAFDYLPGSVLRGVFIGKYMREKQLEELDINDPVVRRLFFDGSTRFLNGYPLDRSDNRMLPTPHSWRKRKGEEGNIFDIAVEVRDEDDLKAVGKPFCSIADEKARLHQPERLLSVHTQRTRRYGRAMNPNKHKLQGDDTPGAIYRYEALDAGQSFETVILCNHEDATALQPLAAGQVFLGKSHSGGYGRACIEHVEVENDWREMTPDKTHSPLTITLLSDTLLRDEAGQYTVDTNAMTRILSQHLDVRLDLHDAFIKTHVVGGFNRKWGLPLPQTLALQMGSVFVFDADEMPDPDKLKELIQQGIGERRAEGFGRVGVNWHTKELLSIDRATPDRPLPVEIRTDTSKAVAKQMLERLLHSRSDTALATRANELGEYVRAPNNSQLSRLRLEIQSALRQTPEEGRKQLLAYLDSLQRRKSTRDQFTRDRIVGKQLLDWLRERTSDEQGIWNEIRMELNKLPQLGGESMQLTPKLVYEHNLRLIDAVLARAAKLKWGAS